MLDIALLVDRLVLAGIFATAGAAKLIDRPATRTAFEGFGIPGRLAGPLAVAIPVAELGVALALLPTTTAWWAGIAALLLLGVFSAGIVINLRAGRAPDCNCFGQVHAEPVSTLTLVRNLLFALAAVALVWFGRDTAGASAVAWVGQMDAPDTALATVNLLLLAGLLALARRVHTLTAGQKSLRETVTILEHLFDEQEAAQRRHGSAPVPGPAAVTAPAPTLPVGSLTPDFSLELPGRGRVGPVDLLLQGKPIVLVFVSRSCGPCRDLLPKVEQWVSASAAHASVLTVVAGSVHEHMDLVAEFPGVQFAMSGQQPVADMFGAKWTPAAVVLDAHGHVREAAVFGGDAILEALGRVAAHAGADAPAAQPMPAFTALLPSGEPLASEAFRAATGVALLYWRQGCPFCAELSADLQQWAAHRPTLSPELVLLVRDEADAPERFGAALVVDAEGTLTAQLDLHGTPSAVFLDAAGRVAPFRMAGPPEIRALLGIPQPAPVAV
jgi:thiol-disulfide isomerase/thioredoxin